MEHHVCKDSMVHIPLGEVHGATGRVQVLVVGIPDIADDDLVFRTRRTRMPVRKSTP